MTTTTINPDAERILVLAPTGRDVELVERVLEGAALAPCACTDLDELRERMAEGAAALVVAEEAIRGERTLHLFELLAQQPEWSDLPVVVLTSGRATTREHLDVLHTLERRHAITFLERPVRIMTLVSTLRAALEARRRQYEVRDLLERQAEGMHHRDEFLALLGHELRNPLGAMRYAIETLRVAEGLDQTGEFARDVLDRQITHMGRLIDDLLELSRISRGKFELRREHTGLHQAAHNALEMARSQIEEKDHRTEVALDAARDEIEADPARIAQAITNLLSNAARYTSPGGRIRLSTENDGDAVELAVADDGVGLEREDIERIFDPFVRIERHGAGLGVGLTFSRKLAEMHGGTLRAESEGEDQGARFVLRLPLAATDRSAADRSTADAPGQAPPRRVLIIEDQPDQARGLALVLERMGHEVRVAHEGGSGITAAESFRPEAVLLDIDLPDIDGTEVARRLRDSMDPCPKLIAVTGFGTREDRERLLAAGCDEHLAKPATSDRLNEVLAEVPAMGAMSG